jgi:lipopolysaccharide/colanic/teichoic acid biosynthesis glycosyltransferase
MVSEYSKLASPRQPLTPWPGPHPPRGQRAFDLVVATILLILISPVFAVIMIWIKCDSDGPVFFKQPRIGRFGIPFLIYKFRTMVVDAERLGSQLTVGRDPRITRCGHLLRGHKLDEFPQLLNVLKGEMSLVGPRPEVPSYVATYSEEQRRVLALRPGMTGRASIIYNNESDLLGQQPDPEQFYRSELIPAKIEHDLEYARHATVLSDSMIILKTFLRVLQ